MNLSNDTINVLKNFATINPNLVIKPGQKLKTISEAKTILASSDIVEDFAQEFGIYDLNEFLSVYGLIEDATLEFSDKSVTIKNDESKRIQYYFSEIDILTQPSKDITMPDAEVGINLTDDNLKALKQASSVLGHTDLALVGENGVITAKVFDEKDATSNTFELTLDRDNACKNDFNFVVNMPNLKLLPGDYFVSISSKLISNWTNNDYPVEYFIALEKTSTFNV